MPKLFVHGNPETQAVWSPLVAALSTHGVRDIVLVSPPGFGVPIPDGFGCTRVEYRDWLIGEIERIGAPVDLVGHDWGAGHVYGVLAERPDLVRSWAADCAGLLHPDYVWHDAAQVWQDPNTGEAFAAQTIGLPPEAAVGFGAPPEYAPELVAGIDATMVAAMLPLYRSAVQPALRELGAAVEAAPRSPGLVIEPDGDPFVPAELSREMAARLGAELLSLPGCAHWWMWQEPETAAAALAEFWRHHDGA